MATVRARLARAVAAMAGPAANQTVDRVTEETVTRMKALAPVLSGELRNSIHEVDAGYAAKDIVAESDHAGYVEFGTSDTPMQPFFRPPLHEAEQTMPKTARTVYRASVPYLD